MNWRKFFGLNKKDQSIKSSKTVILGEPVRNTVILKEPKKILSPEEIFDLRVKGINNGYLLNYLSFSNIVSLSWWDAVGNIKIASDPMAVIPGRSSYRKLTIKSTPTTRDEARLLRVYLQSTPELPQEWQGYRFTFIPHEHYSVTLRDLFKHLEETYSLSTEKEIHENLAVTIVRYMEKLTPADFRHVIEKGGLNETS